MSQNIVIYTTSSCPFCHKAKLLFDQLKMAYNEISVDNNQALRYEMSQKAGKTSVPQIWINDIHIGGCDDLYDIYEKGNLQSYIQNDSVDS